MLSPIALLDYLIPLISCISHKANNKYLSKRIFKLSMKKCGSVFNFVSPNFDLNKSVLVDFIYISLCKVSKQNLKEPLILSGKT